MRVNLLFGFLGSGKTTLARRLLTERGTEERMAVIVNEFGDVGIDGAVLEGRDVDVIELTSGCLCCTLKGSLLNAVEELRQTQSIDHVVIEATGVAQPEEMIETFSDPSVHTRFDVGPMVTVVDTPKFSRLRTMLGEFYTAQVVNADIIVLNKIDLASAEDLEAARAEMVRLNPEAAILFTERCDMDAGLLFNGPQSAVMARHLAAGRSGDHDHDGDHSHDHDHGHDGDHRHAPADSFVLDAGAGTTRPAIEGFFAGLPEDVWRAKGFIHVDGAPSLIQYAMGQLEITPAEERPNRHMVFIGHALDRAAIEAAFAAALTGPAASPSADAAAPAAGTA